MWKRVDGSGSIESVTEKLKTIIMEEIKKDKNENIKKLWI